MPKEEHVCGNFSTGEAETEMPPNAPEKKLAVPLGEEVKGLGSSPPHPHLPGNHTAVGRVHGGV